jgi:hypothetical protein
MDMEYVTVRFADDRTVFINGKDSGRTNEILRIGTGTQEFDLGEPRNYRPEKVQRVIENTNALDPAVVEFQKVSV